MMHWLELFNSYFSAAGGMLAIFMSGARRTPDSPVVDRVNHNLAMWSREWFIFKGEREYQVACEAIDSKEYKDLKEDDCVIIDRNYTNLKTGETRTKSVKIPPTRLR
jgi:hypothetical protein